MSKLNPCNCAARKVYEWTRNTSGFTVPGKWKRTGNQHAKLYTFQDGSVFIVYIPFQGFAYRGTDGNMYARRISNA